MLLFHETQIFTSYLLVVDYLLYLLSTIPLTMYNICICIDTVGHKIQSAKLKKKMRFIIKLRTFTCQYKIIEFIRYIKVFPKEMTKIKCA